MNYKNYYIHKDKTVEFFGNHPVVTEYMLMDIVEILSRIPDAPYLSEEEDAELTRQAEVERQQVENDIRFDEHKEEGVRELEKEDNDLDNINETWRTDEK